MARGPLPSWVASLPLWQWYEIPNTALSSVDPSPRPLGISGPSAKINAWCGATLKRVGSVYIIGAAGGHADYAGNEVNALQLNSENPRWVELRGPSPNSQVIHNTAYYLDGKPGATHTYSQSHFINSQNRLVILSRDGVSSANTFPDPPPNFPYVDERWSKSFNLSTGDWDPATHIPPFPGSGDTPGALCAKHPWTEDVYYSRNMGSGWYRWTRESNVWSRLSGTSRSPWYCGAAIDPTRNRMLVAGGYAPINPLLMGLDGSDLRGTFGGLGPTALRVTGYPGAMYDEAADQFIVVHNGSANIEIVAVDAGSLSVSRPPVTGTPPANRINGIHNSCQYVPELRGLVIANKHAGNVYFMRTSG
jgi:hypothetical protein